MNRWLVVAGGVMMNMALGTVYALSAFLLPLEREFGWTRAQTSWVTTLNIFMISAWFIVGGRLNDRKGPRYAAAIGCLLYSLGFLLASRIDSLLGFYLTAGIIVGTGNGFGYVVPLAVYTAEWKAWKARREEGEVPERYMRVDVWCWGTLGEAVAQFFANDQREILVEGFWGPQRVYEGKITFQFAATRISPILWEKEHGS